MIEIERRRSIRKYKEQPVEKEKIVALLENAHLAPSGSNTQPWHFIIVTDKDLKAQVAQVCHKQKWMLSAPVFIVCVADLRVRLKSENLFVDEESSAFEIKQVIRDTSIAVDHLLLEAVNQDLDTCWVAWYTQKEIREPLNIPSDKFVVGVITLGYADEVPKAQKRKALDEIVHYDKW